MAKKESAPPPPFDVAVAELLSPAETPGLDRLIASLPRRPRYLGPEAWLAALREFPEDADGGASGPGRGLSIARGGGPALYSRERGEAGPSASPSRRSKEKSW
jgi:hypothetical protein